MRVADGVTGSLFRRFLGFPCFLVFKCNAVFRRNVVRLYGGQTPAGPSVLLITSSGDSGGSLLPNFQGHSSSDYAKTYLYFQQPQPRSTDFLSHSNIWSNFKGENSLLGF